MGAQELVAQRGQGVHPRPRVEPPRRERSGRLAKEAQHPVEEPAPFELVDVALEDFEMRRVALAAGGLHADEPQEPAQHDAARDEAPRPQRRAREPQRPAPRGRPGGGREKRLGPPQRARALFESAELPTGFDNLHGRPTRTSHLPERPVNESGAPYASKGAPRSSQSAQCVHSPRSTNGERTGCANGMRAVWSFLQAHAAHPGSINAERPRRALRTRGGRVRTRPGREGGRDRPVAVGAYCA